ncbi:MAG TPA: L,D-transpeptidase [Longimicrobiaceae bacterium]|nr:L,D-transpeptidase [Longimicrobiaceae bacterium]
MKFRGILLSVLAPTLVGAPALPAQSSAVAVAEVPAGADAPPRISSPFEHRPADPASARIQRAAERAAGVHLVISLAERRVWLMDGQLPLYSAEVAVGKPVVMEYEGKTWRFSTPRGRRRIIAKETDPVWVPPEWHYVEVAALGGWKMARLERGRPVPLSDGSRLVVRGRAVGRVLADGSFERVPVGQEIVFDDTVFIPPAGTANREIPGELGKYKLDMGDGYYLHGTPDPDSVGGATSHGCIRLLARDLKFLYRHVRVGTAVYIY